MNLSNLAAAHQRRGNALLPGLIIVSTVSLVMAGFLSSAVENSESVVDRVDRFELKRAASSVNRMVAQKIWSDYQASLGLNERPTVVGMRTHLDGEGLMAELNALPVQVDMLHDVGLAVNEHGKQLLGDAMIESIRVQREDDARSTTIFVTTVARTDDGAAPRTETLTDVFALDPPAWDGLDFALLANNINCIMCHTTVDDTRRRYPQGALAAWGGVAQARVGSIESFQLREDPESAIFGSLYLGGGAIDEHGAAITDWAGLSLKGAQFDGGGRMVEDLFGNPELVDLEPVDRSVAGAHGNLFLNYLDPSFEQSDGTMPAEFPMPFADDGGYDPATRALTLAGADDRKVDDNEFFAATESFMGSITGGQIGVSPHGDVVTTDSAAGTLAAGNAATLGSSTDGNVILTGTDMDPIRIDGQVAIDGDLVISGPIVGTGSLWVRGNVYVRGDLEYQDAVVGTERQYGIASDGTENALGLTSGGNVVIGDPYRPAWGRGDGADGTESGSWNFTLGQAAAFNGREWLKTQPTLPGAPFATETTSTVQKEVKERIVTIVSKPVYKWREDGTFREKAIYENVQVGTKTVTVYETIYHEGTEGYDNGWTEKVAVGTKEEPVYERQQVGTETVPNYEKYIDSYKDVEQVSWQSYDPKQYEDVDVTKTTWTTPMETNHAYAGPDYVPRYYGMGPGDPVPIQTGKGVYDPVTGIWEMSERVDGWDSDELTLADPSDPADPFLFPAAGNAAVVTTLEPSEDWIDPDVLRGLIQSGLNARDSSTALKLDATVYSANSIFGVVPDAADEGTNGQLRVQGALLAADLGLLGPKGIEVIFDPRGGPTLDVRDQSKLALQFVGTLPAPLP